MATIKAGTYIFKEQPEIANPKVLENFTYKTYFLTGNNTYSDSLLTCYKMYSGYTFKNTSELVRVTFSTASGSSTQFKMTECGETSGWVYHDWNDGDIWYEYTTIDTTKLRTIIIETDQTVADDFYIWFTSNASKQKLSVDLTTLPGWANLSAGNHTIKIKAKGTGYKDSELSAGVVVSKAPSTVTLEAGTYKFVETPQLAVLEGGAAISFACKSYSLTANNVYGGLVDYSIIYVDETFVGLYPSDNDRPSLSFSSDDNKWTYDVVGVGYTATDDNKLRTIIVETDQQVSPEFYNWAITDGNLVKQAGQKWTLNSEVDIASIVGAGDTVYLNNVSFTCGAAQVSLAKSIRMREIADGPDVAYDIYIGNEDTFTNSGTTEVIYSTAGGATGWFGSTNVWTFNVAPTGDLLTWLNANGTKSND